MELHDTRVAVNDLSTLNGRAANEKRQLETAVHTLHAEIDSFLQTAKNAEEKAKKAMVDASRLADELRAEQDHCSAQAKAKRALEAQVSQLYSAQRQKYLASARAMLSGKFLLVRKVFARRTYFWPTASYLRICLLDIPECLENFWIF